MSSSRSSLLGKNPLDFLHNRFDLNQNVTWVQMRFTGRHLSVKQYIFEQINTIIQFIVLSESMVRTRWCGFFGFFLKKI